MADTKISALTGAATPLAGTEVLPIVQAGATVKVAVDNLTVQNIRSNATSGILQITGPAAASTRVATVPDANFTAARIDAAQTFVGDQRLSTGNLLIAKTTNNDTSENGLRLLNGGSMTSTMQSSTNDDFGYVLYSKGASAYRFYVGLAGTVFATNTTISAISDARFKENIRPLDAGLAEVMALQPRLYDWKEGKGADIKNARGFIAQEFEQVFPDLIDEWRDPAPEGEKPYKSVRADLVPVLVKAMQEQQALIQALTARVAALESAKETS
jgi:hypothetical protein